MNSLPGLARACLNVNNDFRLDGAVEKGSLSVEHLREIMKSSVR